MEILLLGLLIFSLILFVISFFLKDPSTEIRNELDQFMMQQVQEMYQIKRKIKILEEELLIDDSDFKPNFAKAPTYKKEIHAIIKNQVWSLSQQGVSLDQIARQSSLSKEDVYNIINEFTSGDRYE